MNLELVGKDVTPSPALRERIEAKLTKLEARLGQKLFVRVSMAKDAGQFICTVHFTAAKHEYTATASTEDLGKSVDEALSKVDRQVRKMQHKGEANRHASIRTSDIELETDAP